MLKSIRYAATCSLICVSTSAFSQQSSNAPCSPNIQNVGKDVTVTIQCSDLEGEISSLIQFYQDRTEDIEEEMHAKIKYWKENGPTDPSHRAWRKSVSDLQNRLYKFRQLHERHIEAIKSRHLTLAAIYANSINGLLSGEQVSYRRQPPWRDFRSSISYPRTASNLDLRELIGILKIESMGKDVRYAAANLVIRACENNISNQHCPAALGAIVTSNVTVYTQWSQASYYLCNIGEKALPASKDLIDVLSNRANYEDWRLWIISMEALSCIGPEAHEAVPYIADVMVRPKYNPDEYYNTTYIQEKAAEALAAFGSYSTDYLPQLKELSVNASTQEMQDAIKRSISTISGSR